MDKDNINARKKKIGFLLSGNDNWVGGLYYVLNLIKSLYFLDKDQRPAIYIIHSAKLPDELFAELTLLKNKGCHLIEMNTYSRICNLLNRTIRKFTKHDILLQQQINPLHLDVVYPLFAYHPSHRFLNSMVYYWIPDFQHKYLPEMFSTAEIAARDQQFLNLAQHAKDIILSSKQAKAHFNQFYPESSANIHVLSFVSVIDIDKIPPFDVVAEKYEITKPYFIICNQFWQHKNHLVVLRAINELKDNLHELLFVFTGKQHDHRNPGYFDSLLEYIRNHTLENHIRMLGFIPRDEQLCLIKNSLASIQPSKFEGWSTVNEDCKALNKTVISSDIDINHEQLGETGSFFKVNDHIALSKLLLKYSRDNNELGIVNDYTINRISISKKMIHILNL